MKVRGTATGLLLAVILMALQAPSDARAGTPFNPDCVPLTPPVPLRLIEFSAVLGVIDYFAWVSAHEGSHALAITAEGGEVTGIHILPQVQDDGHLSFGYTVGKFRRPLSTDQEILLDVAPKITDLVVLGAYAAALDSGRLPDSRYGRAALAVLATGALVDFSKDTLTTYPADDMVDAYEAAGLHAESQRRPWRLAQGGLALVSAVHVGYGWYKVFERGRCPRNAKLIIVPTRNGLEVSGTF